MEATEIRKLAQLEDEHWWYRERRNLLARMLGPRTAHPGRALDIGAAAGGNTQVLRDLGYLAIPVEYGDTGAKLCHERGLPVVRGDACRLPLQKASIDLVVAFDLLEHLTQPEDALAEMHRVVRPGGTLLIAVPANPDLWSAHDEAVGHVCRYTREALSGQVTRAGFDIDRLASWNVLLYPAARWRRRFSRGSDLEEVGGMTNRVAGAIVALERWLPVGRLPGVSLVLRATPVG